MTPTEALIKGVVPSGMSMAQTSFAPIESIICALACMAPRVFRDWKMLSAPDPIFTPIWGIAKA